MKDLDLAHEADCLDETHYGYVWAEKLRRYAALVRADEREAILQMSRDQWFKTQADFEEAIRARNK